MLANQTLDAAMSPYAQLFSGDSLLH